MNLGAFSLSINSANLEASRRFYESIGFTVIDGDDETWAMMSNGESKIGIFQEMLPSNIITFHSPDARAVEQALTTAGYTPDSPTEGDSGPTHFLITDPDGNAVMFDQHTG